MYPEKIIHQGRNLKRFREMLGIKQDGLAFELGNNWNQRKVSKLEQKEEIDQALLEELVKILKVPVELIKNFDEDLEIKVVDKTLKAGNGSGSEEAVLILPMINPIDKWNERLEENRKLYELLLKEKDDKIELLERLLDSNK
jgi:transcriptional regulator with XRE-family HTH domain